MFVKHDMIALEPLTEGQQFHVDHFNFELGGVEISSTPAPAWLLAYMMMGGEQLEATVGSVNVGSGDTAVTGVGFQPDLLIVFGHGRDDNNHNGGNSANSYSFGVATDPGSTEQWSVASQVIHIGVANLNGRCFSTGKVITALALGSILGTATLDSFDSDGFTLNASTALGHYRYIAIRDPLSQMKAGYASEPTSDGTQTITVGFPPGAIICGHASLGQENTYHGDWSIGIGMACERTGSQSAQHAYYSDVLGAACYGSVYDDRVMVMGVQDSGTFQSFGDAELTAYDATSFDLDWTNVGAGARDFGWLAFEDTEDVFVHYPAVLLNAFVHAQTSAAFFGTAHDDLHWSFGATDVGGNHRVTGVHKTANTVTGDATLTVDTLSGHKPEFTFATVTWDLVRPGLFARPQIIRYPAVFTAEPRECVQNLSSNYADVVIADGVGGGGIGPVAFWQLQECSGDLIDHQFGYDFVVQIPGPLQTYRLPGPLTENDVYGFERLAGSEAFFGFQAVSGTNNMALEVWLMLREITADDQVTIYSGAPNFNGWGLVIDSDRKFKYKAGPVGTGSKSATALTLDTWHHIVITRDAGTWHYYLDGVEDTANAGTHAPNVPSIGSGMRIVGANVDYRISMLSFWDVFSGVTLADIAADHYAAA